jgi:hypothetical protein
LHFFDTNERFKYETLTSFYGYVENEEHFN